jgi:hypothetical protein
LPSAAVKSQPYYQISAAGYKPVTAALMTHFTSLKLFNGLIFAILFIASQTINTPANAQIARHFPDSAVRGNISFKSPPQIELDGKAERLSPGARIRDEQGMLAMTGALEGKTFTVNFRREAATGLVHEVWILTAEEAKVKRDGEKK